LVYLSISASETPAAREIPIPVDAFLEIALLNYQSFARVLCYGRSRAAAALGIAQPPLSQQIKALETELNVQLFDRTTHPIQLTLAGHTFLREVRAILRHVDQAAHTTR
jgi:hypothetical protein